MLQLLASETAKLCWLLLFNCDLGTAVACPNLVIRITAYTVITVGALLTSSTLITVVTGVTDRVMTRCFNWYYSHWSFIAIVASKISLLHLVDLRSFDGVDVFRNNLKTMVHAHSHSLLGWFLTGASFSSFNTFWTCLWRNQIDATSCLENSSFMEIAQITCWWELGIYQVKMMMVLFSLGFLNYLLLGCWTLNLLLLLKPFSQLRYWSCFIW